MKALLLILISFCFFQTALAGDIKWEGTYRFEALRVNNPGLDKSGNKAYVLHHFVLRPQFQAYDGLTIHSRFDLFNNDRYPNDQMGQTFGSGFSSTPVTGPGTDVQDSNTIGDQQRSEMIRVNELYANWVHEFGVLTVGRAPIHFGLGINFNGGYGMFDHWLDNRDMIAYKVVMGNFSFMPVIAKSYEGNLNLEDDVNDYILQVNYGNPETDLEVGFIYQARRSTSGANSNDVPINLVTGGTQTTNYEVDSYNVFVSQWVDEIKVAFELGFHSGNTGITNASNIEVAHDAFGGVLELEYAPESSSWGFNLDLGYASGDDPATDNKYEGYIFDRNYDVAMLLFNHPMGQADFFRTAYVRDTTQAAANTFDSEAISNTIFASGGVHYKWGEGKYDLETRLTYAQLNKDPLNANVDSGAGFEVDLSLKYEPFKGFQWINRAGVFLPGAAFEGGAANNYSTDSAFGLETKAAISF